MDRLPALIVAAAAALAGCESDSSSGEPSSRVDSVKGKKRRVSAEELCDVRHADDRAPRFALPALAAPAPAPAAGWRWVNVWATWCKPCLEEMPRLERWAARTKVELVLISADEPGVAVETPRLADPDALPGWLTSLGLDGGSPIPIHVLVDPEGRTRCVRAGGVSDDDLVAAEALLGARQ
jgi:thiol-disulfide isomerase/thioredoxin